MRHPAVQTPAALTSNGFVFTVFRIAPLRMHWVQIRIDLF